MPINTPTGYLDITNATLRGSKIVTTGFVGIANANPTNHLSIGSNLHINDTHSNVLQVSGNINAASVVLGGLSIAPTFDLEIVTNTGNTTPYTVEFNNTATAFVTTANATIGDTLTASKLVGDGSGISAIQSSNVTDFASNVSRITNLSSNLSDNSSRITALESGDISISGDKTFTGDIIFESNVHMNSGNVFVANTVNMTVSDPIIELGSNNLNTGDLGIIMTRHGANSNVAVVYDEDVDILRMGYTLNGASDSVISLDSNALAVSVQGELTVGGNVGIGTDNPLSTLQVGDGTAPTSGDATGSISLYGTGATKSNGNRPGLYHRANVGLGLWSDAHMSFEVNGYDGNQTEAMRILTDGNVGIGTTSPDRKLVVETSVTENQQLRIRNNNSTHRAGIAILNNHGHHFNVEHMGDGSNVAIIENYSTVNSGIQFYAKGDGEYRFYTTDNNDERVRILNSGNVGIGTTSPFTKLVIGSSASGSSDIDTLAFRSINNSAQQRTGYKQRIGFYSKEEYNNNERLSAAIDCIYGDNVHIPTYPGVSSTNLAFTIHGRSGSPYEAMRITHEGRVGIRTTGPNCALDVGGSINNGTYAVSNGKMANRSLTIGDHGSNYGGGTGGWNSSTAGFIMECLDNTEIGIHDSGTRVASFMYFEGGSTNRFTIGRNMGWGTISSIALYGNVGIGTNAPLAALDVPTSVSGTISVNNNQGGYWFSWNTTGTKFYSNQTVAVAGNFDGGSVTAHTFYAGYSIQFLSDRRIKKDIREIDDESALEKFRLLKPSKYKYIEPLLSGRTDKEVYGFIAQEVAEVLPEGVTIGGSVKDGTNQGHIPNIMSMCSIESQNISSDAYENLGTEQKGEYIETGNTYTRYVVTITKTIDPSTFNVDGSTRSYKFVEQAKKTGAFDKNSDGKYHPLVFYSNDLKTICTDVVRVIDDSSFVVDKKLDLNQYEDGELLLYGQKPDDFYRLNKDSIFTLASAALQEVDRQQQADKVRIAELETQVASLLERVTALENA